MPPLVALGVQPSNALGSYQEGRSRALGEQRAQTQNQSMKLQQAKAGMELIGSTAMSALGGNIDGQADPQLWESGLDQLESQGVNVAQYRGKPQLAQAAARGSFSALESLRNDRDEDRFEMQTKQFEAQMLQAAQTMDIQRERLGIDKEKLAIDAAEVGMPNFKDEFALSKDYQNVTKGFRDVRDAFTRINVSAKNPSPAGDLALIFNYMKMLDPGSTVREGEFATAEQSAGLPKRIVAQYNKVVNGERLEEGQRSDFVDRAKGLYAGAEGQFNQTTSEYRRRAGQYGFDADRVLSDFSQASTNVQEPNLRSEAEANLPVSERRPLGEAIAVGDGKTRDNPVSFASVEAAEDANLPAGTWITVNGRRGQVQ